MLNKIILISIVAGFLLCNPASGEIFTNGGFETGDLTGWTNTHNAFQYTTTVGAGYANNSDYGLYLYIWGWWDGSTDAYNTIHQTVDLTNIDKIRFDLRKITMTQYYYSQLRFDVSIDGNVLYSVEGSVGNYERHEVNVSAYSGNQVLKFGVYNTPAGSDCQIKIYLDNIVSIAGEVPINYITWETWPADSWKVGNYSTLMIGVPASQKNFTFFYKTPSTNYIEMPIQKHFIHKTFNVEEGEFYYYYAKFPYHATYGNYSAKIELNEAILDSKSVIVPYFDPDITLPDTVIIPIPEVFVDPPQWNVTIPEEYGNVTWLTDYTAFCDGIGNSMNYTTYATVGLLLIPLEMLNGSVTTVHEYATDAAGMVAGFEHCSIIIKVAWEIIPSEIQTLFVGAAALGLVVFLYHRRA